MRNKASLRLNSRSSEFTTRAFHCLHVQSFTTKLINLYVLLKFVNLYCKVNNKNNNNNNNARTVYTNYFL